MTHRFKDLLERPTATTLPASHRDALEEAIKLQEAVVGGLVRSTSPSLQAVTLEAARRARCLRDLLDLWDPT